MNISNEKPPCHNCDNASYCEETGHECIVFLRYINQTTKGQPHPIKKIKLPNNLTELFLSPVFICPITQKSCIYYNKKTNSCLHDYESSFPIKNLLACRRKKHDNTHS